MTTEAISDHDKYTIRDGAYVIMVVVCAVLTCILEIKKKELYRCWAEHQIIGYTVDI